MKRDTTKFVNNQHLDNNSIISADVNENVSSNCLYLNDFDIDVLNNPTVTKTIDTAVNKKDTLTLFYKSCMSLLRNDEAHILGDHAIEDVINVIALKLIEATYDFETLFDDMISNVKSDIENIDIDINKLEQQTEFEKKIELHQKKEQLITMKRQKRQYEEYIYIIPFLYFQNFIDYIKIIKNYSTYHIHKDEIQIPFDEIIDTTKEHCNEYNRYYKKGNEHIIRYINYLKSLSLDKDNSVVITSIIRLYRKLYEITKYDKNFNQIFIALSNVSSDRTIKKLYAKADNLYDVLMPDNNNKKKQIIDMSYINFDIVGDAYENLKSGNNYSGDSTQKSYNGQYFTPEYIDDILIYLTKPKFKIDENNNLGIESFFEPALGSARIIKSYTKYFRNENIYLNKLSKKISKQKKTILDSKPIRPKKIEYKDDKEYQRQLNQYRQDRANYRIKCERLNNDINNDKYYPHKILNTEEFNVLFNKNIYGIDVDEKAFKLGLVTVLANTGIFFDNVYRLNSIMNTVYENTHRIPIDKLDNKLYYFNMAEDQTVNDLISNVDEINDDERIKLQNELDQYFNKSVVQNKEFKQFDIVSLNPPFGVSINNASFYDKDNAIMTNYYNRVLPIRLPGKNSEMTFLEYALNRLKVGGRCSIILPEGSILKTKTGNNMKLRELLFNTCKIKKIIRCPRNTFDYTAAPTIIIDFEKIYEYHDFVSIQYHTDKKTNKKTRKIKNITINSDINNLCTNKIKFYNLDDINAEMNLYYDCKYQINNRTQQDHDTIYKNFKEYKAKPFAIVNKDQFVKENYSLFYDTYVKYDVDVIKKDEKNKIFYKKLSEICEIKQISTRKDTDNVIKGKYDFYCSNEILKIDTADHNDTCLIIGPKDNIDIRINSNFSCTSDYIVIQINNDLYLTDFIYNYLLFNLNAISSIIDDRKLIDDFDIPDISIDKQLEIINYINKRLFKICKINRLKQLNKLFINNNVINYLLINEPDIFRTIYDSESYMYNNNIMNNSNMFIKLIINKYTDDTTDTTDTENISITEDILPIDNTVNIINTVKLSEIIAFETSKKSLKQSKLKTRHKKQCNDDCSDRKILKFNEINSETICITINIDKNININVHDKVNCSDNVFVFKSNDADILDEYIYYYLISNIDILKELMIEPIEQNDISIFEQMDIKIPSIENQMIVLKEINNAIDIYNTRTNAIELFKETFAEVYKLK